MLYNWTSIDLNIENIEEGKILEASAGEKQIALIRRGETVYAFAVTCPHASARLCEGWLDAQGRIVCPLHKYRFDPANGRNTSGEGYKLRTYPVEIREGIIFVGLLV